jgi:hypothetical protein
LQRTADGNGELSGMQRRRAGATPSPAATPPHGDTRPGLATARCPSLEGSYVRRTARGLVACPWLRRCPVSIGGGGNPYARSARRRVRPVNNFPTRQTRRPASSSCGARPRGGVWRPCWPARLGS